MTGLGEAPPVSEMYRLAFVDVSLRLTVQVAPLTTAPVTGSRMTNGISTLAI